MKYKIVEVLKIPSLSKPPNKMDLLPIIWKVFEKLLLLRSEPIIEKKTDFKPLIRFQKPLRTTEVIEQILEGKKDWSTK